MIIFPAVDIRNGCAVRLKQGKKEEETVFSTNPVEMARYWQSQGAEWLHVIDLDGAFEGAAANARAIGEICKNLGIPVQAGGGIRSAATARAYLDAGVTRVITGTVALEDPAEFALMCSLYPGKVGVSLDAAGGRLKTRGWLKDSGLDVLEILPRLEDAGAAFIVYTDIERDGMQSGINTAALTRLLESTSLPVIAAGGVSSLRDVINLHSLASTGNLEGMISGRALYEKTLDLGQALAWLRANP